MKRSIAFLFACSIGSISTVAAAGDLEQRPDPVGAYEYDAAPAVLFIPDASIPLTPSDMCAYPQGGGDHAGLGCVAGLEAAEDYTPPDNIETIADGMRAALAPYNVLVTSTRPPEYVPYMLLLPGEAMNEESISYTCAGAGIDCDGVGRNDIGLTNGGTMNCTAPDPLHAALIAFGYMSGLENNDNPMDPMFYPPDFSMPATEYQDMCATLVPTLDDMGMDNLPVCVSFYHETHCDDQDGQINSHLELLGVYGAGPAVEDTTPPEVTELGIADMDGVVFPAGTPLPLTATVTDDSGLVFVRWTLVSTNEDFLMFDANGDGAVCKGHNDVCEVGFEGAGPPYYQVDGGDYGAMDLAAVPGGDYQITFEASDLTGNVAEAVTVMVTVEGGGSADTTGGNADTTDGNDSNDSNDSNDDDGNDESSSDGGSADSNATGGDEEASGCSCNTDGDRSGAAFMLIGLAGLGLARRRTRR